MAGLLPVVVVFLANPLNRVYSHHGYIHTSIVYRIVHTGVPPTHPFLADQPLPYYWGYHWLAAGFVKLGMTPGWAGVLINVVALIGTLGLAWWIARELVAFDPAASASKAGLATKRVSGTVVASCAAFAAIFSPAYLSPSLAAQQIAGSWHFSFPDPRALPIAIKFVNQSGMALGVLFALGWIASMIGMYQGRAVKFCALAIAVSLLGCGFFYPPMLPSLVLGTPSIGALFLWRSSGELRRLQWRRTFVACLSGAAGVSLTMPYLLQVAESLRGNTRFLDLEVTGKSLSWAALLLLPTLAYGWAHRIGVRERLARTPLFVLLAVAGSSLALYLSVGQPLRTEYKYLSVAMMAMGFLGGAIFALAWNRSSVISWVIAGVFVLTPGSAFLTKFSYHMEYPTKFVEAGPDLLFSGDDEREALFSWIREESPANALFIDPIGTVPIYGQRGALITPDQVNSVGFGGHAYEFLAVHDRERLTRRYEILEGRADEATLRREIPEGIPVYFILERDQAKGVRLDPELWELAHRTPKRRYRVVRWLGDER